ncbi:MAG UNVERIFIED_CONTAM: hypothetical protein LVT10_24450 [Anaerolineae bacterium]|jgi:hypothetical protein
MSVEKNVLIYDGDTMRSQLNNPADEARLKAEWCHALREGPGVFVVKRGYPNTSIIDRSTDLFRVMRGGGESKGSRAGRSLRQE